MTQKWTQPDILICNGDAIEGNQSRQGGAELITPDRSVQCDMAVELLSMWQAKQVYMTYGTPYHVGQEAEDFERSIAHELHAHIEGHLYIEIEGLIFDVRHKIGTSSIPHGRATALLRDLMWGLIAETTTVSPHIDVLIRSHAHYHIWVSTPGQTAFITPALQLARGRFGSRECSGVMHWGAVRLTVDDRQIVGKDVSIWNLQSNRPRVFKIK